MGVGSWEWGAGERRQTNQRNLKRAVGNVWVSLISKKAYYYLLLTLKESQ